jgi:hypothetical protein
VVDLAWAVLEAGAAADSFASTNTNTSSSSSSDSGWALATGTVIGFSNMLTYLFGQARSADAKLTAWQPHAQQFASDALLKLMLVHAGMSVGLLYTQQQQQQRQGKQPGVQPYHQQLLAELGVQPLEHLAGRNQERWLGSSPLTCTAVVSILDLRLKASATTAASSSSKGGLSPSPASPAAAQTSAPPSAAAAAIAMGGGVGSRLYDLLLLTVLECAVLTAAAEDSLTSLAAAVLRCLDVSKHVRRMQLDTRTAAAGTSAGEELAAADFSNLLLQPLLLELAPAAMQAVRAA